MSAGFTDWDDVEIEVPYFPVEKYSSRYGAAPAFAVVHHSTTLTLEQVLATFQGSRQASTHYAVQDDRPPWQFVYDNLAAWSTGSEFGNTYGISIEHCNSALGDASGWPVSDATIDTGAHLVAALHVVHGWGRPSRATVKWHQEFYATACPGPDLLAKMARYITLAQDWYDQIVAPAEPAEEPILLTDVFPSNPQANHILAVYNARLMIGFSDKTWRPAANLPRRDCMVTLWRAGGDDMQLPRWSPFADFPDVDTEGFEAVVWADAKGVTTGYEDQPRIRTFRPGENVSRIDAAAFLARTLGLKTSAAKGVFPDVPPEMAHAPEVEALAAKGIVAGFPDGDFRPYTPVARQDWAALLARAFIE